MVEKILACKSCSRVFTIGNTNKDEFQTEGKKILCPKCGGELTKEFNGYLVITDWTKSDIAKKMDIKENGKYALKVR